MSGKLHGPCPRCGEAQFKELKPGDVCQACVNETKGCGRFIGRHTQHKTGQWADLHERRY